MRKHLKSLIAVVAGSALSLSFSSCTPITPYSQDNPPTPNPKQTTIPKAVFVNPYPSGTYANFKARPDYRKTYDIWKNHSLLNSMSTSEARIQISLSKQRAILYKGNEPVMDYPVATGKSAHKTPTGSFKIIERIESDSGGVVKSGADARKDKALINKPGNKFQGALMAYWMRLTNDGIGMHKGNVPRYPASHGCIRTYYKAVPIVFRKTKLGTPVSIVN